MTEEFEIKKLLNIKSTFAALKPNLHHIKQAVKRHYIKYAAAHIDNYEEVKAKIKSLTSFDTRPSSHDHQSSENTDQPSVAQNETMHRVAHIGCIDGKLF